MEQLSYTQQAVLNALDQQSWFTRRKDTFAAVAGTVIQVANVAAALTTTIPSWANALIAVTVGLAQVFVHAGTKGAITPSMADRLDQAAPDTRPTDDEILDHVKAAVVEASPQPVDDAVIVSAVHQALADYVAPYGAHDSGSVLGGAGYAEQLGEVE